MKRILLSAVLLISGLLNAQVANDECANAIVVPVNTGVVCEQSASATLTGATASINPANCTGTPDDDIWFQFTASHTSHRFKITTTPALPQMVSAALYTGDCSQLTHVSCIYSNTHGDLHNLVIGQTYKLRVFSSANAPQTTDVTICILTLPSISVSTNYTDQQLVQDVLIDTPCLQVSNITSSGGLNFGKPTSLAYFEKGISNFPFEKGILLSTGSAILADDPNILPDQASNPGWPGDADLQAIFPPTPGNSFDTFNDATSLEFDFIPAIDHISFDFIFASEEYGTYQCTFGDAFAFILTDMNTGEKKNLAVIPNTTTPVAVTTVNNSIYLPPGSWPACPSQNPEYFGAFYNNGDLTAPINFNGHTVPLTAESAVTPGHQYHIKLVIANKSDHQFNSAVFIDAGSFNIGGLNDQYVQLTSSAGNILCNGATTLLSLNADPTFNYLWSTGETTNTITATQAGTYAVAVSVPNSAECMLEYSITLIDGDSGAESINIADYWIYEENSDGVATFNLATKTDEVTNLIDADNVTVSYYLTLADAQSDSVNVLPMLFTNTANPQTIFARIENTVNGCFTVTSFKIGAVDENYVAPMPVGNISQTFTEGQTLADLEVEGENIQWYLTPGTVPDGNVVQMDEEPLPLTTLLVDGTTYYASQTLFGIESTDRLPVTVNLVLGLNEHTFAGLSYSNPVNDILNISNSNSIDGITMLNMIGQTVLQQNVGSNSATINTAGLQQGVYLLTIKSGPAEKTIKIIKE